MVKWSLWTPVTITSITQPNPTHPVKLDVLTKSLEMFGDMLSLNKPSSSSCLYIWNQGSAVVTWYIGKWELGSKYIGKWKTGWWLQPIWKIYVKLGSSSPNFGVKITHLWNHHLGDMLILNKPKPEPSAVSYLSWVCQAASGNLTGSKFGRFTLLQGGP